MISDVIILCGGLGTRLRSIVKDVPKPLAQINGKPFLDILINSIRLNNNIGKVILAAGYKGDLIKKKYSDKSYNGLNIDVNIEDKPLGTGGAIKNSLSSVCTDNFIVINGDSFIDQSLDEIISFHSFRNNKITITIKHEQVTERYGLIEINKENMTVKSFIEKDRNNTAGYINSGIYVINRDWALNNFIDEIFSIEDLFQKIHKDTLINCFISNADFIDIGTEESYNESQSFFK